MRKGTQCWVTGGTGFIGRHLVRTLLRAGARVHLLCRDARKARELFADAVTITRGDLREPVVIRDAEWVFHVGARYAFGRRYRREMEEVNVAATVRLLDAARRARVERFLFVSSASVLANRRAPITERDFPNHVPVAQAYRRSKWLAERACQEFAARGLPVVIANPTSPLGPEDEAPTPTGRMMVDFLQRRFPAAAHTRLNFVNVRELAEGLVAAAERGRVGERYLLAHHDVWLLDFLRLLGTITGRPAPRWTVPWPVLAVGGLIGEWTNSNRLCRETAWHCLKHQPFDARKAAAELGWQPRIPLEQSARAAVAWFQNPRIPEPHFVEADATA